RQKTTRRIKGFWRCISRCSCRESIPTSSRGRQRLKSLTVLQYIYKSIMGGYSGVKGQHWGRFYRSRLGRGGEWEGIFLWRNTHRPKMVDNVYSSTWGRGMSARGFKQR